MSRVIRAPRGTTLHCKNWQIEAPYRTLMNNLDPEVAEDPGEFDSVWRSRKSCKKLGSF
ncbi:hypothetical protein OEI98_000494 [Thermoanaerobacter sp. RKWS2]|nr:hypothetical protein [Thermoanaerobacter sp. RKWS2]UZQ83446.1 hypothetical protein OEI98_000494 [Thermoanaerobacter sp. RKWS2]